MIQKIIPHLWFDNQATEAAEFYMSVFSNSRPIHMNYYGKAGSEVSGMPESTVMSVEFELEGQRFITLNGGPVFTFTPSISFFVNCDTPEEVKHVWNKLEENGQILMELGTYPFSEQFGWLQDRYGVSWQINLSGRKQKITPYLMFSGEQFGKVEEAVKFYTSLFDHSNIIEIEHYDGEDDNSKRKTSRCIFTLSDQEFMALDSGVEHPFHFTEAISLFVNCVTQEETDFLWEKLCEEGEEVKCGWLKDKYGVSWQIVPTALNELLNDPDPIKSEKVMTAMLQMKKIDSNKLKQV